jgi:transcriptional regulator with XRE-family HTH domain
MDKEKRKKIGERLKQVRKTLGLLQKDVAKEFGIGRTQMTNIEKGKTIPAYLLDWLQETHRVSIDWIYSGHGDMFLKRTEYHVDVKKMIDDFEEHPEFMHRILSEYYMLKPHYIKLVKKDKDKGLKKKSKKRKDVKT